MSTLKYKKVLLVEDDLDCNFILSATLRKKWIDAQNITIAKNWQEALIQIQKQLFDIIIMDIRMPIMDGIEATKHIRNHYNGDCPKIVAFSAINKNIEKGDDNLFDEYILKPFSQYDIEEKIIKVLLAKNN